MTEHRRRSIKSFLRTVDTPTLTFVLMMSTFAAALLVLLLSSIPGTFWRDMAVPVGAVVLFYCLARTLKWWASRD